jgi:DNA-binding transcriptional LysR family regulator
MREREMMSRGNPCPELSDSWKQCDDLCRHVLSNLPTVELIGRWRNKSEAARKLNITAAAISSRFKLPEEILGGLIVEPRTGDLTPIGKVLRQHWEHVRTIVGTIAADIARLHDQHTLRVAVSQHTWNAEGGWLQREYAKSMPDVAIEALFEDGYLAIENQVRDGIVDLGIVSCMPDKEDLECPVARHHWRKDEMVLVAGPGIAPRVADDIEVKPGDFAGLHDRFFTMPEHTRMHRLVEEYMRKHRIGKCFRHKVPLPDIGSILDHVKRGHGVSILPEPAVKQDTRDLNIDMFLLNPSLKSRLDCLYRERGLKTRLVSAFLECVDER